MYGKIKKHIRHAWLCKSWLEVKEIRVKESADDMNLLKVDLNVPESAPTYLIS